MREFGDQKAENKSVETWRVEQEWLAQKEITDIHRTLDSAENFGPGEEVLHLGSEAAHRRATSITETSGSPQQWAEPRLEAVRKGQVCQAGVTDFGPGVERFSEPCAKKE